LERRWTDYVDSGQESLSLSRLDWRGEREQTLFNDNDLVVHPLTRFAMKVTTLFFAAAVLATSLVSSAALAQSATNTGKTRAEVKAELVAAERSGQIPVSDADYPSSADTIKYNHDVYVRAEQFSERHPHSVLALAGSRS
jgi:hypothetical protein